MARKVALKLNIPRNCIQKVRNDIHSEHSAVLELSHANLENIDGILEDIGKIKGLSDDITNSVSSVNYAIEKYNKMANEIDKIAMHINIISLNASVEAARAGQHGKTFAVVAEEIRNLASSSKSTVSETQQVSEQATTSIKEINTMVDLISTEVEKAYGNISFISEETRKTLAKSQLVDD
ncbi:MAG: methyl-accepting chemotaxis protein [Clostridiales bacterium]|nr:methyl-accepting chemotaxis protein [Clostridiales bacterium]